MWKVREGGIFQFSPDSAVVSGASNLSVLKPIRNRASLVMASRARNSECRYRWARGGAEHRTEALPRVDQTLNVGKLKSERLLLGFREVQW